LKLQERRLTKATLIKTALTVIVVLCGVCQAKVIPVGKGSYTDDLAGFDPEDHGTTFTVQVTDDAPYPYPTSDWWTSLLADNASDERLADLMADNASNSYSRNLFAFPLAFRCDEQGLLVDRPDLLITSDAIYSPFEPDIRIGVNDVKHDRALAAGWGDFTVDIQFPDKQAGWTATIGHGLPFAYASFTGGTPEVTFLSDHKVVTKTSDGMLVGIGDEFYGIYFAGGQVKVLEDKISLEGCTFLAVAALPGEGWFERFKSAGFQRVTDSRIDYSYNVKAGEVTTTYRVETRPIKGDPAPTYLALFPHHYKKQNIKLTDGGYDSLRGRLKILHGNEFTTVLPFHGMVPFFPEPTSKSYDPGHLKSLLDKVIAQEKLFSYDAKFEGLAKSPSKFFFYEETYFRGKQIAHIARLIPIADRVGHDKAKKRLISELRKELVDWFTATPGEKDHYFYYDRKCGGLVGMNSSFYTYNYVDHHFHYSHFVYASAILSMYDADFKKDYGQMVELLIHDYNTPDRDHPMFPHMRMMDPYEGHCWANGFGGWGGGGVKLDAAGNDQESSSEAMHAWQAIFLWGMLTGNDRLRDHGAWGYVTEASAINQYYFDVDDDIYPNDGEFKHDFVSLLYGGKASHLGYIEFPEYTFAIQYLPVTPSSLYLGYNPEHVQRQYANFLKENGGPENTDGWYDNIWMYQAMFDADAVLKKYDESVIIDTDGNSFANIYRWLHFFKGAGQVDVSVAATWPYYSAFRKGDKITLLAYNPGNKPVEVPFKVRASGAPLTTLAVAPGSITAGTVINKAGD
jgi:hypothetical protein